MTSIFFFFLITFYFTLSTLVKWMCASSSIIQDTCIPRVVDSSFLRGAASWDVQFGKENSCSWFLLSCVMFPPSPGGIGTNQNTRQIATSRVHVTLKVTVSITPFIGLTFPPSNCLKTLIKKSVTDGTTDQQTNGLTDTVTYRVACPTYANLPIVHFQTIYPCQQEFPRCWSPICGWIIRAALTRPPAGVNILPRMRLNPKTRVLGPGPIIGTTIFLISSGFSLSHQ